MKNFKILDNGNLEFICNKCKNSVVLETTKFYIAIDKLIKSKWNFKRKCGEWENYCPTCFKKEGT